MRRREFIGDVGGAAAWPLAARAQQPAIPVIGFLSSTSPQVFGERLAAFAQGLKEEGYIEGRTWLSNNAGRGTERIDCHCSRPIWFAVR